MEAFFPIAVLFVVALVTCGAMLLLTSILGPRRPIVSKAKLSTYECGVAPEGNARIPFRSHFYLVAVLFLLFDVEAAFFFPWALVYKESLASGGELLIAFMVYMFFMLLGLVYVYRKKALEISG